MKLIPLVVLVRATCATAQGVPVVDATQLKTFGVAKKAVSLVPSIETDVLRYAVPSDEIRPGGTAACLTQMWFAGETSWVGLQSELELKVYVDDERTPSIKGPVGLLHGFGFDAPLEAPWATASVGKLASLGGGLFNSPFRLACPSAPV